MCVDVSNTRDSLSSLDPKLSALHPTHVFVCVYVRARSMCTHGRGEQESPRQIGQQESHRQTDRQRLHHGQPFDKFDKFDKFGGQGSRAGAEWH